VIEHLETLDERIQAHLEGLDPPAGAQPSDGEGDDKGGSPPEAFWLDEVMSDLG
jgi:hypothetical protein